MTIGFMLMVGLIGGGLAGLATSGLTNRNTLELVRNRQYAADGAIEESITQVRIDMNAAITTAIASGFSVQSAVQTICASAGGSTPSPYVPLNTFLIRVDWVNACRDVQSSDGSVLKQRNVIFTAYECTGASCDPAKVITRAQVNFQRASPTDATKTYVLAWSVNQ